MIAYEELERTIGGFIVSVMKIIDMGPNESGDNKKAKYTWLVYATYIDNIAKKRYIELQRL